MRTLLALLRSSKRRPVSHGKRRLILEPLEARALLATLPAGFAETVVASNLSDATAMEIGPNGDVWVLEQGGAVKRFRPGSTTADVVGNLSTLGLSSVGERGVLGIAFDPQYAINKRVYLYYTATQPAIHNRISRFTVIDSSAADYYFAGASTSGDAGASGTPTQTIVLELDNLSGATNHNGGAIHFGPDGKLYAAVGDNANSANAQTLANLHGKILRMNSDGTAPADNPFFGQATGKNQLIWALGLRNPYTFAFQPGTGRMFINDVGQTEWEEINDGIAGSNYGWPRFEGNEIFSGTTLGPGTYQPPVYAYPHGGGTFAGFSITGGAFYNPAVQQFPTEYVGDYFFGDYVNDWINVRDAATGNVTRFATNTLGLVDLRVASDGSLYYVARNINQVLRVTYPQTNNPPTISAIGRQTMTAGQTLNVGFTVGDDQVLPENLTVDATSDNTALLPTGSMVISGTGASRTLQITPQASGSGRASVTLTVSDGSLAASTTFELIVASQSHPWHNPVIDADVNLDFNIVAGDVVIVINLINANGSGPLSPPTPGSAPPPYVDVAADNHLAPNDALRIINHINANLPAGEGEASSLGEMAGVRDAPRLQLESPHSNSFPQDDGVWDAEHSRGQRGKRKK
jgi:glucose/arabinose dehydrogenase